MPVFGLGFSVDFGSYLEELRKGTEGSSFISSNFLRPCCGFLLS